MAMVTQERFLTAEDLWELSHQPENAGKRFRLMEGVLYEVSPTGWLHGDVVSVLHFFLMTYVRSNHAGRLTGAETGFVLRKAASRSEKDTVLAPDIGFIRADAIPPKLPVGYVPFAPDLAIEVLSPTNTATEIGQKVILYLRYGTRLVWIVDPDEQTIQVYRPTGEAQQSSMRFLTIDDTLDGEDVLPGFSLPLRELFQPPTASYP